MRAFCRSPLKHPQTPMSTESSPAKVALITGITGQDGSYLTELLLEKVRRGRRPANRIFLAHRTPASPQGYVVHGIIRRSSSFNTGRIEHLYKDPHQRGVRIL